MLLKQDLRCRARPGRLRGMSTCQPVTAVEEQIPIIITRDQGEAAMAVLVALTLQRDAEVGLQNASLVEARKHDEAIAGFSARMQRWERALEKWAHDRRKFLGLAGEPGEKKSLELRQGTLGFRWGNRKVQLLEGFTEETVMQRLRGLVKKAKRWKVYIRVKEDLDKRQVLDDTRPEVALLSKADLTRLGLSIGRDENFYIEPKLEQAAV